VTAAGSGSRADADRRAPPLHVGLFSPGWPASAHTSGVVTYVHNLRAALIELGHRVSVFANQVADRREANLVEATPMFRLSRRVASLAGRGSTDVFAWGGAIAAAVKKVHRRDPIDVLEMEETYGWCAQVQRLLPMPVVVKLHGPAFLTLLEEERATVPGGRRIDAEGAALKRMRAICAPAQSTLSSTLTRYGLAPEIQATIANPVQCNPAGPAWSVGTCTRNMLLFVGRFDRLKGGDVTLLAFRRLLDTRPDLTLSFVGPDVGLQDAGRGRVGIDEFADALFLPEQRARLAVLGVRKPAEIEQLRLQSMVTIVASRWENQPNTALEAMALGCPVVGFEAGGMGEIIEDGRTGCLAPAGDVEALAAKVALLLDDPGRAEAIGAAARQYVLERHSARAIAERTVEFYRRALAAARQAAAG